MYSQFDSLAPERSTGWSTPSIIVLFELWRVTAASSTPAFSLIPREVKSPETVLFKCQAGSVFCARLVAASWSRSACLVASSLSTERTILIEFLWLPAPDVPAVFRPPTSLPGAVTLALSTSIMLVLIHVATSRLSKPWVGRKKGSEEKHRRWDDHIFCLFETLQYKPHLSVEALHTILATSDVFRIFVVNQFGMTDITVEGSHHEIDNFVGFKGREGFATLGTYVSLVVKFLQNSGW